MQNISKLNIKPTNKFYYSKYTPKSHLTKYRKIYILHEPEYVRNKKVYATHLYYVPVGHEYNLHFYYEPMNDPFYNKRADIRDYRNRYNKYNIPKPAIHERNIKSNKIHVNKLYFLLKLTELALMKPITKFMKISKYKL